VPEVDDSIVSRHPLLLPAMMIGGATLGILIGGVFGSQWKSPDFAWARGFFRLIADILLNSLKMLVVPLIVCSVIHAVASIGDIRKAGRIFIMTICYFLVTMMIAVSIGMVLVNTIKPGVGASTEIKSAEAQARAEKAKGIKEPPIEKLYDVVRQMFPANLFKAAAEGEVLGLIIVSIVFGGILSTMGARGLQISSLVGTLNDALMIFVHLVIWFAPVGIMGVVAERIGSLGGMESVGEELRKLFWYALTVILGLLIHGLVVLPTLLYVLGRRNPVQYIKGMFEALVCAFSTASSAATLPLTIKCLEKNNGISKRTVGFVVPLGATVNMNGTALYEAVAAIFIAQAYGIELDFGGQLLILFTATLAAIGAAAIPEAGLVTMVIVLVAVGLPVEGIGLILAIDWIIDRCRTTVNVWDDSVASAVVERWMTKMDTPKPLPHPELAPAPPKPAEVEGAGK
jgi:Na+/H+-dicarboxylate symporter